MYSKQWGTVVTSAVVPKDMDITCKDVCEIAEKVGMDIKKRIRRGEALRAAKLMRGIDFGNSALAATVELSNQGQYNTTNGVSVNLSQHYEGYEGISCMFHTEGDSSSLVFAISVGASACRGDVKGLIESTIDLFKSVADVQGELQ